MALGETGDLVAVDDVTVLQTWANKFVENRLRAGE
jgi:hypothetical protein